MLLDVNNLEGTRGIKLECNPSKMNVHWLCWLIRTSVCNVLFVNGCLVFGEYSAPCT